MGFECGHCFFAQSHSCAEFKTEKQKSATNHKFSQAQTTLLCASRTEQIHKSLGPRNALLTDTVSSAGVSQGVYSLLCRNAIFAGIWNAGRFLQSLRKMGKAVLENSLLRHASTATEEDFIFQGNHFVSSCTQKRRNHGKLHFRRKT